MATAQPGFWQQLFRRNQGARQQAWTATSQPPPSEPATSAALPAAPAPPLGKLAGYTLQRVLVQGPQGALYLADAPRTGEPVALKTVRLQGSEHTRERFLHEAETAARLQHPHIVQTFASGVVSQSHEAHGWIAMEWVPGGDLIRYTTPGQLLPEGLVLQIGAAMAEALAHAHRQGVVHRDLKPANVMFNPANGMLKLGDFGCARLSDAERSRSGLIVGTPGYMAPEQLSGLPLDGRCDLYALGVLLFELLTGRLPFAHASMGQLLVAIATEPAPRLDALRPELPPLLADVIARLLSKHASQRHVDGTQLARELRLLVPSCTVLPETRTKAHDA
ncbi:serine/threonine-protein kinase [Ideonella azotifigens]|uniref:serine/threonine-protein kinase n=1 Tax=Ideonella azotifigens TaxID=513160 RepID=UPI001143AD8E|nr:serine/threonine-protein kinase [Ideonella azotifigens]